MGARDDVNNWLRELGSTAGIAIALDDNGVCGLKYKDNLEVIVEVPAMSNDVYIYSPLLKILSTTAQEKVTLYEELLKANFLCQQTKGATLSIDEQENSVVLCINQSIAMLDAVSFRNLFGNFIDIALDWKARLIKGDSGTTGPSIQESPGFGPLGGSTLMV